MKSATGPILPCGCTEVFELCRHEILNARFEGAEEMMPRIATLKTALEAVAREQHNRFHIDAEAMEDCELAPCRTASAALLERDGR